MNRPSLIDALLLDPHPVDVWIAYRTDGIKGCGTQSDPFNGSTQAQLDAILASLPSGQPVHVHLGPSPRDAGGIVRPFLTGGFWVSSAGIIGSAWQARPNMRISGAGQDVTVLRLAPGSTSGTHYFAVGASTLTPVDRFELRDLTIDCNLPASAAVACGAVRVMGNHVRIQNVKCIEWGSRTTAQPGFVIALLIADPEEDSPLAQADDAGIEDCIAVSPSAHNDVSDAVVNILHAGGREVAGTSALTLFGRVPFIRHCFVDCDTPTPAAPAAEYRALSMGACRGGIVEGNQVHNTRIGGPYQEVLNTADIIVRQNTYRNVVQGPYWNLGVTINLGVQRLVVEGNHIELLADDATPAVAIQIEDGNASAPPAYVHDRAVIRHNTIRYVDGVPPEEVEAPLIQVAGVEHLIVQDNLFDTTDAEPIQTARCGSETYFDNRTPTAALASPPAPLTDRIVTDLEMPADDALVLACFSDS